MIRQGDILLAPLGTADVIAVGRELLAPVGQPATRAVLAYGEVTGHSHVVEADTPSILTFSAGGRMLLHIAATGRLLHEDHDYHGA
jgi:hypothetical protein